MSTDISSPNDAIDQMVSLRLQRAELDRQIDTLKPKFLEACADLNISQLRHEQALISRRLAPGKWGLSEPLFLEHEKQLKRLKQQFQETHEPAAGREVSWAIKLLT